MLCSVSEVSKMGIALSIIPLILLYTFLSRYIIGGVTAGGVKQ